MSGKRVWVVGTDIGGTFTDVIGVNLETGEQRIGKVPSTPPTFFDGVINGLARAGLRGEETLSFRHGATVSTNAILERKGVKTALITTEGFRDVLGGGRAERISAFELDWDPPELIVPRRNVLVVRERVSPYGEIVTPLEEADVQRAARMIRKRGIESVAVVYMDSFMNPVHERRTREILRQELPDIDITLSHEVLPQMLEFERTCTTVLNAYVSPILKNYLQGLADRLKTDWGYDGAILVTTSGGGVIGMEEALKLPARTFHSSPVSGAVGLAGYIGSLAGFENVIAFETGGTTNNVSIIYRGRPAITHEWKILWNVPCCLPSVDTVYIGAGGGSIGWVDKGGILNVGPQSMGAVPGPACYGAGGTEPTNTDTQIVLGRIDPNYYLGGEMQVDAKLSRQALETKIGHHYAWDAETSAANMYMVAMTNLMMAMRLQTVSRGWDPRDFAIVPYGGGGAMYACDLAREIGASTVIVPPLPGYASAFGAIRVDVKHEFTIPLHKIEAELDYAKLNLEFDDLVSEGARDADAGGHARRPDRHRALCRREVFQPIALFYGSDQERAHHRSGRHHARFHGGDAGGLWLHVAAGIRAGRTRQSARHRDRTNSQAAPAGNRAAGDARGSAQGPAERLVPRLRIRRGGDLRTRQAARRRVFRRTGHRRAAGHHDGDAARHAVHPRQIR